MVIALCVTFWNPSTQYACTHLHTYPESSMTLHDPQESPIGSFCSALRPLHLSGDKLCTPESAKRLHQPLGRFYCRFCGKTEKNDIIFHSVKLNPSYLLVVPVHFLLVSLPGSPLARSLHSMPHLFLPCLLYTPNPSPCLAIFPGTTLTENKMVNLLASGSRTWQDGFPIYLSFLLSTSSICLQLPDTYPPASFLLVLAHAGPLLNVSSYLL